MGKKHKIRPLKRGIKERVKASSGLFRDAKGKWRVKRIDFVGINITAFRDTFRKMSLFMKKPMRPEDFKFLDALGKGADNEALISRRYGKGEVDRYMLAMYYHRARVAWLEKYPQNILDSKGNKKYDWKKGFRKAFKYGKYPKLRRRRR